MSPREHLYLVTYVYYDLTLHHNVYGNSIYGTPHKIGLTPNSDLEVLKEFLYQEVKSDCTVTNLIPLPV